MHQKISPLLLGLVLSIQGVSHAETSNPPGQPAAVAMVLPDANGPGYTLVVPRFSTDTVLLDGKGREVHVWPGTTRGGGSARMLPDGSLLRLSSTSLPAPFNQLGVDGGRLQHIAWDGKLLWDFVDATSDHMAFGDLLQLPNGNILVSVLEFKTRQECEGRGREPGLVTEKGLLVPGLMEFSPKGKSAGIPVWKWSLWDHLYQGRNPNLPEYHFPGEKKGALDLGSMSNSKGPVWMTPVEIDYLPEEDLVLMVVAGLGEVWVLDHGITTSEAATRQGGHRGAGGQLLVRWKGPTGPAGAMQPPASRVISARWAGKAAGTSNPVLTVMRYEEQPFKPVVESLVLNPETWQPAGEAEVLFRPKPKGGGEAAPLPTGMDWLPEPGVVMFAEALHGRVHLHQGAQTLWSHTNQHGKVKLRPQVGAPGEECCGNGKAGQMTKAPEAAVPAKLPEFEAAPLTRVRLYAPAYLKP